MNAALLSPFIHAYLLLADNIMNHLTSAHVLNRTWLYCTVFLTGATVMVIELLGTRLIAPFYDASLYVWTSVISVTLIALAAAGSIDQEKPVWR